MLDNVLDTVVLLVAGPSLCAGSIVAADGLVATAYHCVAESAGARVVLRDGRRFTGKVVARDPAHDLALVRFDAPEGLPVLPLRGDLPTIGERVYAAGHPFGFNARGTLAGTLRWSVSEGIVGAVGDWFVQTDASVNPGNSGGPLVDAEGRMVGVVSRKLRAENLGFATPSPDVASLVATPRAPRVGGAWGAGVGMIAGQGTWFGVDLWMHFRPAFALRGWAAVSQDPDRPSLWAATADLHLPVGDGPWAPTFELGGGVSATDVTCGIGEARIAAGPLGLAGWLPVACTGERPIPAWTLDLALPGKLGVF